MGKVIISIPMDLVCLQTNFNASNADKTVNKCKIPEMPC